MAFPPFVVSAADAGAYRFSFEAGVDGYAALSFAECGDAELGTSSAETSCFGGGSTATGVVLAEWDLLADACYLVRWGCLRGSVDAVAVERIGPFNETRARERLALARASRSEARGIGGVGIDAIISLAVGVGALSAVLTCVALAIYGARRIKAREARIGSRSSDRARGSGVVGE